MNEEKRPPALFGHLAVLLPALWLAIGASFKLFLGGPNDLPLFITQFGRDLDLLNLVFCGAIGIELSIVILALLRPAIGWRLLALQYCIFLGILVQLELSGAASCGCLGANSSLSPLAMMGIDSVLLALLLLAKPWRLEFSARGPAWLAPALIIGALWLPWRIIDSGGTTEVEQLRFVDLQPAQWVDQNILSTPLGPHLDLDPELDAHYLDYCSWVFYRQTCDHCSEHLGQLERDYIGLPMVLVKINEDGDNEENDVTKEVVDRLRGGELVKVIELTKDIQWVIETPAGLELEGGVVTRGEEGIGKD